MKLLLLVSSALVASVLTIPAALASCEGGSCTPSQGTPRSSQPNSTGSGAVDLNNSYQDQDNNNNRQNVDAQVNQSSEIGNTNTQVNVNSIGNYQLGPGIQCATPGLAFNLFGSKGSYATGNFGGTVSYIIPLGGSVADDCKTLTKQIAIQRTLDTCIVLIDRGIIVDPKVHPELAQQCAGLSKAPVAATPAPQSDKKAEAISMPVVVPPKVK